MREEDDQLYVYKLYGISTPRIIKATKTLRNKIGPVAKITSEQIQDAQEYLEECGLDFSIQALQYIEELENIVADMRHSDYNREEDYDIVATPIMQVKGQAGMFGNKLASEVSYMLLAFMEKFRRLDHGMLNIIGIYIRVVRLSYRFELHNTGVPGADDIINELQVALDKYYDKYANDTGK
jgi:hypothetical protein